MNCQEFGEHAKYSFSFATLEATVEWSNTISKDKEGNNNCGEMFGKKLVAAITCLVLPVIALVESVIRGFFAAIATLIGLFIPEGECRKAYEEHVWRPLAVGAVLSFGTFASAFVAFGYNFDKPIENKEDARTIFNPAIKLTESIEYLKDGRTSPHMPSVYCCCEAGEPNTPPSTP